MTDLTKKVATRVFEKNGMICVQYHDTVVVAFNRRVICLDSGGWFTVTTKRRMNQAAEAFRLPFRVYQQNRVWFVKVFKSLPFDHRNEDFKTWEFFDGMEVPHGNF